jgi:hypothetical protein
MLLRSSGPRGSVQAISNRTRVAHALNEIFRPPLGRGPAHEGCNYNGGRVDKVQGPLASQDHCWHARNSFYIHIACSWEA